MPQVVALLQHNDPSIREAVAHALSKFADYGEILIIPFGMDVVPPSIHSIVTWATQGNYPISWVHFSQCLCRITDNDTSNHYCLHR